MSWKQAADILRQNRVDREADANKPPAECPNDGSALEWNERRRIWFCPFDGWTSGAIGSER